MNKNKNIDEYFTDLLDRIEDIKNHIITLREVQWEITWIESDPTIIPSNKKEILYNIQILKNRLFRNLQGDLKKFEVELKQLNE